MDSFGRIKDDICNYILGIMYEFLKIKWYLQKTVDTIINRKEVAEFRTFKDFNAHCQQILEISNAKHDEHVL